MNKIVYVLGAGFSAPLGLPVMNNFIEKSKDIYALKKDTFPHFKEIFQMRDEIACIKNIINFNLHNIEEILSVLEMGLYVGDNRRAVTKYKKYLMSK